ncbi:hypothetical protein [Vibrio phage vB_ValP_FGH]|nr:hypothetical protein [Vibrio phage vB_ValP_FGH]
MAENQVSKPPLQTPLVDATGLISRPWSIWFRDLYIRTAYKGGNAIDENKEETDKKIAALTEVVEQIAQDVIKNAEAIAENAEKIAANSQGIQKNAQDIATNAEAIEQNAEDIAQNADDIQQNAEDILSLEHRAFGDVRPQPYQESGVAYSQGDYVVYPADNPQRYYIAQIDIADPAGPFNPDNWIEKSLRNSVDVELYLELTPVKAVHFAFEGRNTNGPATMPYSFNVATLERTGVGVYEGTVSQQTFYGVNIFDTANPFISYSFTNTITTEAFHVDFTATGSGGFTIEVYEWVQGTGSKIELVPYDPVQAGDLVFCTVLSDLGNGQLPPVNAIVL